MSSSSARSLSFRLFRNILSSGYAPAVNGNVLRQFHSYHMTHPSRIAGRAHSICMQALCVKRFTLMYHHTCTTHRHIHAWDAIGMRLHEPALPIDLYSAVRWFALQIFLTTHCPKLVFTRFIREICAIMVHAQSWNSFVTALRLFHSLIQPRTFYGESDPKAIASGNCRREGFISPCTKPLQSITVISRTGYHTYLKNGHDYWSSGIVYMMLLF